MRAPSWTVCTRGAVDMAATSAEHDWGGRQPCAVWRGENKPWVAGQLVVVLEHNRARVMELLTYLTTRWRTARAPLGTVCTSGAVDMAVTNRAEHDWGGRQSWLNACDPGTGCNGCGGTVYITCVCQPIDQPAAAPPDGAACASGRSNSCDAGAHTRKEAPSCACLAPPKRRSWRYTTAVRSPGEICSIRYVLA